MNASILSGVAAVLFSATLVAIGSMPPYTWVLLAGIVSTGLSLTSTSGLISRFHPLATRVSDGVGKQPSRTSSVRTSVAGYYISGRSGNDSWSGRLSAPNSSHTDGPFQNLARAKAGMRASSRYKTAILRAGTYSIATGLPFNWADSGESWIAYPGETAILDGGNTGGVSITGVDNLSFQGVVFQNMAPRGIVFNGAKMITLRWNSFYHCNQYCIFGSSVSNSIIDSNTIDGQSPGNFAGTTGNAYQAIQLSYGSSKNQVIHNLVENCQGGGIAFESGPKDPPNNNNLIDRNILQNIDTNVVDMGAIYLYDESHSAVGNQITNNVINGNGGSRYLTNSTKAIYLDDGVSNVLVSGNLCRSCGQFAWQIHSGDHNTIVNNIFDLSSAGTLLGLYQVDPNWQDTGMNGNVFKNNIVLFSGATPSSLYQVNINAGDELPAASSNLYYSTTGSHIPNGPTIVDANPVYANRKFAQSAAENESTPWYSLARSSFGFRPLPTDQGPLPFRAIRRQDR